MPFSKAQLKTKLLVWLPWVAKQRFKVIHFYKKVFWFLRYLPGSSWYYGPPRGIYSNTAAQNEGNPSDPIKQVVLKKEHSFTRTLPQTNSEMVTAKFQQLLEAIVFEKKAYFLNKARYLYGLGGTVITSDDKIFLPCSPLRNEWVHKKHQSLYLFKLPKITRFNKVILMDTKACEDNYCHWMRDHLTRFYWLRLLGLNLADYTLISNMGSSGYNPYSYEILRKHGFVFKQHLDAKQINYFYADELVVPSYVCDLMNGDYRIFDRDEEAFLKEIFLTNGASVETYDRIFISRRRSIRSSPQETELADYLTANGIKEIFLEDYNMSEQALLFNKAKIIIGFHGAGFTNTYFCNPDVTIVEIFGADFIVTDFWSLCNRMGLNYYAYCNDEFFKNIQPYRLARLAPTIISVPKLIDFMKEQKLI